eukprot:65144_1
MSENAFRKEEVMMKVSGYAATAISLDVLVNGFVNICFSYRQKYPREILYIIRRYFDPTRSLTFDVCKRQYKRCVKENGTVIERGKYQSQSQQPCRILFASPQGYNQGIHEWKIKVMQSTDASMGIVSEGTLGHWRFQDCWGPKYYIWSGLVIGKQGEASRITDSERWEKGDVIVFCLNCKGKYQWTLTIQIEDKKKYEVMSIQMNRTYYPFIQCEANHSQYYLVGYSA